MSENQGPQFVYKPDDEECIAASILLYMRRSRSLEQRIPDKNVPEDRPHLARSQTTTRPEQQIHETPVPAPQLSHRKLTVKKRLDTLFEQLDEDSEDNT